MSAPTRSRQGVFSSTRAEVPERTLRADRWWLPTLWTNLGFAAFVIYATVRAFMGHWFQWYWVEKYHYLTPFYSPCVSDGCVEEIESFLAAVPA